MSLFFSNELPASKPVPTVGIDAHDGESMMTQDLLSQIDRERLTLTQIGLVWGCRCIRGYPRSIRGLGCITWFGISTKNSVQCSVITLENVSVRIN